MTQSPSPRVPSGIDGEVRRRTFLQTGERTECAVAEQRRAVFEATERDEAPAMIGQSIPELLRTVDSALYSAKRMGRNAAGF